MAKSVTLKRTVTIKAIVTDDFKKYFVANSCQNGFAKSRPNFLVMRYKSVIIWS